MTKKIEFEPIREDQLKEGKEAYLETDEAYVKVKILKVMTDFNSTAPWHFVDARRIDNGVLWEGESKFLFTKTESDRNSR